MQPIPNTSIAPASVPHVGLARVREYLRTHTTKSVSLAELASLACLSKYHFLRLFTRTHGVSPHGYQMRLRLDLACQLIAAAQPLSFVAYEAGFADQSHLTRRFKGAFGVTPGAYAKQSRRPQIAA